jgi:hypothetical protein
LEEGWKTIDSFERLLTEMEATDANDELIVELNYDQSSERKNDDSSGVAKRGKNAPAENAKIPKKPNLLPEEEEFLSETKARRIREGTLRVYRSDYVVEGAMRRLVTLSEVK